MRSSLFITCVLVCLIALACSPNKSESTTSDPEVEITYDSIKAATYGADDYGMRKYVMAFLSRGPNRGQIDSLQAIELQTAHLQNIGRLADEGKLAIAGPFFGDQDLRGIYIFNVESIEEAEALTNSDPAIKAGSLSMELLEWYGSAALMAVNDIHGTLSKVNIVQE